MAWGKGNQSLVQWYAKLANIRKAYSVLSTGDIAPLQVDSSHSKDVLAYSRDSGSSHAVIAVNRAAESIKGLTLQVSSNLNGTTLTNALNKAEKYKVQNGSITVNVPAQSGVILVTNYTSVNINNGKLKDAYDPKYIVRDRVGTTGITLNSAVTLTVGKTVILKAIVTPKNATLRTVTWSSSNEHVAKIDSKGQVRAIGVGTAVITGTTVDGEFSAKSIVTVVKAKNGNRR
jgi:uncharacterized protein YjdB